MAVRRCRSGGSKKTPCRVWLRAPDGNLVVCGGSEYVMEEFEGEETEYTSEYVRHMKIPRGEYRATIYMYFGGVNGRSCISAAREGDGAT